MKTVTQHIRDRLLACLDKPEPIDYQTMLRTEWSDEFIRLMRNRMVMGGYRYGLLADNDRPKYDNVGSLTHRAKLYLETGNLEHLVDIANLALIEYVRECCHPNPHWAPIDDGYHTEELK